MCGIKIPQQKFALKMQGDLCAMGGRVYLQDTTVKLVTVRVSFST